MKRVRFSFILKGGGGSVQNGDIPVYECLSIMPLCLSVSFPAFSLLVPLTSEDCVGVTHL